MGRTHRTQVALYLDDWQIVALAKVAEKTKRTKQDVLREAINTLLVEYKPMWEAKKR